MVLQLTERASTPWLQSTYLFQLFWQIFFNAIKLEIFENRTLCRWNAKLLSLQCSWLFHVLGTNTFYYTADMMHGVMRFCIVIVADRNRSQNTLLEQRTANRKLQQHWKHCSVHRHFCMSRELKRKHQKLQIETWSSQSLLQNYSLHLLHLTVPDFIKNNVKCWCISRIGTVIIRNITYLKKHQQHDRPSPTFGIKRQYSY